MEKKAPSSPAAFFFSHPFVVVPGIIVIAYAGYLFGQQVYQWLH